MKNNTDFIYLLRFIAAILVVFYHYSPTRNFLINSGDDAVSFFFLLSGFILVVAYEKQIIQNNLTATAFYVKRIARVYPLYFLALALTLVYHFFIHNEHTHLQQKLPFEIFMVQTWFFPGSINYPAWSISCEFFFYLLFPMYIVKMQSKSLRTNLVLASIILIVTVGASYFLESQSYSFLRPDMKGGYLYQSPFVRLPIFLFGNVLGLMYIRNIKVNNGALVTIFLLGCLFIYLWTFKPVNLGLSLKQVGLLFIYAVLIIVLLQNASFSTKYLSNKKFIVLGDISYGVYILQFPISSFVLLFENDFLTNTHFYIFLGVLLLCSYFAYKYFEKPLRSRVINMYKSSITSKKYSYTE